jgi:DNA-binding transcriptional LysR family regulator
MQAVASAADWNDLKYFLACWRAGSLAGAGRQLQVDQTTVGRRLRALERVLGARLFEHTAGGLVLTPTGEGLIETAQAVEQGVIDIERKASGEDARLEGAVRVATTDSIAASFLLEGMVPLHREHPGIELEVVSGVQSLSLLRREADVAVRAGPRPSQQSLIVRKLGTVGWPLYTRADSRAGAAGKRPPAGGQGPLDGRDVIAYCEELGQMPVARWMEENGAGSRVAMRVNSLFSAASACEAGWGVAALPAYMARRRPGLVRVLPEPVSSTDIWLLVHPDLQRAGRVRAVMEHIAKAVARTKALAP